jgi:Flp pilus assembly protein TadD
MDPSEATARFERLSRMHASDSGNLLLLAELADAAIAAGRMADAERHIDDGMRREGTPAWRYRLANLRIAQRRHAQARELLLQLRQQEGEKPAIDHNLAYLDFLDGDHASSTRRLERWLALPESRDPSIAPAHALWLRGMHAMGRLDDAWTWIEANRAALGAVTAGPASLIALDRGDLQAADEFATRALNAEPSQVDALVARASVALHAGDARAAKQLLEPAARVHSHQARLWITLGYAELVDTNADAARTCFGKALELAPGDLSSLLGQGWAAVLQRDPAGARRAFELALQAHPDNAEVLGGLAFAEALGGSASGAGEYVRRARQLDRENVAAAAAEAMLTGAADAAQVARAAAQKLVAQRANRPRNSA